MSRTKKFSVRYLRRVVGRHVDLEEKLAEDAAKKMSDDIIEKLKANTNLALEDALAIIDSLPEDVEIYLDKQNNIRLGSAVVAEEENKDEAGETTEIGIIPAEFSHCSIEDGGCFQETAPKIQSLTFSEQGQDEAAVAALTLAEMPDKDGRAQIEILREGVFQHFWYGEIVFNRDYFLSAIANFLNDTVAREVSFDFQHQPEFGAAAWVKRLGLKARRFNDGQIKWVLTADVEYTDMGREAIESKRFKYFSSEVLDNFRDRESQFSYGPTLMGGGLTNRPYIPGMKAVPEEGQSQEQEDSGEPAAVENAQFSESTRPSQENGGAGVKTMEKLEEKIKNLQAKFDAIEDKESETAKLYSEQIEALKEAQKMLSETSKQVEEQITAKLSEQAQKLQEMEEVNKRLLAEAEAAREERRLADVELFCRSLAEAGHTPAVVSVVKKHLTNTKAAEVYRFADDEGKEQAVSLKVILSEVLEAIPSEKKVTENESLKQSPKTTSLSEPSPTVVKLSEDKEIDVNDPDRIKASLARHGYKVAEA